MPSELPDVDRVRAHNSRSTRRWCRGRVGVLHQWEWRPYGTLGAEHDPGWPWIVQVCTSCGRHGKLRDKRRMAVTPAPQKEPAQ